MNLFKTLVILLLLGMVAGLGYNAINIETRAMIWEARIESAEEVEDVNMEILKAHEYSDRCLEAVRMLANENGILCEREVKMVKYLQGVEEENARLKVSLKEAVSRLQEQIEEINNLHQNVFMLEYKVKTLEQALNALPDTEPPMTYGTKHISIYEVLEIVNGVTGVITILPILL